MADPLDMEFFEKLPEELRTVAYCSGGEYAWAPDDMLKVIECASAQGLAILGGEIWLPTTPGPTIPTPYIYTWDVDDMACDETWAEFVERANAATKDYVLTFAWDEHDSYRDRTPYFNFVLVKEGAVVPGGGLKVSVKYPA